jgi:hypothetical protein
MYCRWYLWFALFYEGFCSRPYCYYVNNVIFRFLSVIKIPIRFISGNFILSGEVIRQPPIFWTLSSEIHHPLMHQERLGWARTCTRWMNIWSRNRRDCPYYEVKNTSTINKKFWEELISYIPFTIIWVPDITSRKETSVCLRNAKVIQLGRLQCRWDGHTSHNMHT